MYLIILSILSVVLLARGGYHFYLVKIGNDCVEMRKTESLGALVENRETLATSLLGKAFVKNDPEIFQLLLEKGAKPSSAWIGTKWGREPLIKQVVEHEDSYWTEQILKHGANPNQHDNPNRIYPVTFAIEKHRPKNAKLLVDYGADVNVRSGDRTLVAQSWSQWQHEVTYYLLIHGVDINTPTPILKSLIGQMQSDLSDRADGQIFKDAREYGELSHLRDILKWFEDQKLDWRRATFNELSETWTIPRLP